MRASRPLHRNLRQEERTWGDTSFRTINNSTGAFHGIMSGNELNARVRQECVRVCMQWTRNMLCKEMDELYLIQ